MHAYNRFNRNHLYASIDTAMHVYIQKFHNLLKRKLCLKFSSDPVEWHKQQRKRALSFVRMCLRSNNHFYCVSTIYIYTCICIKSLEWCAYGVMSIECLFVRVSKFNTILSNPSEHMWKRLAMENVANDMTWESEAIFSWSIKAETSIARVTYSPQS